METRRPPGPLPVVLIAAAMYFAASEAAIHLLPFRLDATVVWFASGIGLAALLVYGPMAAWGVALGALDSTTSNQRPSASCCWCGG